MENRRYPTDLSNDEWRCISPHLPEPAGLGRPRLHGLRAILDAVFYVLKSGCPWRLLPRDFPPWKTVYDWFRDGGKKVRGRKRHLLVDTEGLVLRARVHSAKVHDEDGIKLLLESARIELSRLKHLWVDAGYRGRGRRWAEEVLGLSVEVVRKPQKPVPEKVAKV
jgi:putative transposase